MLTHLIIDTLMCKTYLELRNQHSVFVCSISTHRRTCQSAHVHAEDCLDPLNLQLVLVSASDSSHLTSADPSLCVCSAQWARLCMQTFPCLLPPSIHISITSSIISPLCCSFCIQICRSEFHPIMTVFP